MKSLGYYPPEAKQLMLTLQDKEKYVVHHRNLQFYLSHGLRIKKVHRVLELEQECWMKPYIEMNTDFRKKRRAHSKRTSTNS